MRISPAHHPRGTGGRRPSFRRMMTTVVASSAVVLHQVESYVVNPNGAASSESILSRFTNVQCELFMTVGRTPDTAMPPEWASSGAKLGLPLNVKFSAEPCESNEMNREPLLGAIPSSSASLLSSPSFSAVQPLNEPSFTSANGVESVKVTPGAYACLPMSATEQTQQYSFRFFLDFPEGAVRNDVELPAERIYFMTSCWNEDNNIIETMKSFKELVAKDLEETNDELDEMQKNASLSQVRQYFSLMNHRRKLAHQMEMLEDTFPPDDRLVKGPANMTFLKEGVIAVKRFEKGNNKEKEEYHWVGTFRFGEFRDGSSAVSERGLN